MHDASAPADGLQHQSSTRAVPCAWRRPCRAAARRWLPVPSLCLAPHIPRHCRQSRGACKALVAYQARGVTQGFGQRLPRRLKADAWTWVQHRVSHQLTGTGPWCWRERAHGCSLDLNRHLELRVHGWCAFSRARCGCPPPTNTCRLCCRWVAGKANDDVLTRRRAEPQQSSARWTRVSASHCVGQA